MVLADLSNNLDVHSPHVLRRRRGCGAESQRLAQ